MIREKMNEKGNCIPTLFGLAVIAMVALAACGSALPSSDAGASVDVTTVADRLPADFRILVYQGEKVVGGQEVQFSELLGQGKPVVLNLWAGLCPPLPPGNA